ncbi:MAG: hypothetical protein I8H87_08045 [Comamonadaceae bacterium]|nr:hypothetical protein [Comamonadaceae bacterium]
MTDFIIKKLPYDLSSHAGLALIGKYLKSIKINSLIDSAAAGPGAAQLAGRNHRCGHRRH